MKVVKQETVVEVAVMLPAGVTVVEKAGAEDMLYLQASYLDEPSAVSALQELTRRLASKTGIEVIR